MVVNFGHVVFAQVRQLVANLNKKNFKATSGELNQLLDLYGHDVYVFLFRSLINQLDLKNTKAATDQTRLQLLAQELGTVITKPNFVSVICQAFEGSQLTDEFCSTLAKTLKLTFAQHVTFGIALAQSHEPSIQNQGVKVLKSKLPECTAANLQTLPMTVLCKFVGLVQSNSALGPREREPLIHAVQSLCPPKECDLVLFPLLYAELADADCVRDLDTQTKDVATVLGPQSASQLAEAMEDMGYGACGSVEVLRELVLCFGDLDEDAVAEVLAMMARTHTGLPDALVSPSLLARGKGGLLGVLTPAADAAAVVAAIEAAGEGSTQESSGSTCWDLDVLVEGLAQLAPALQWPEVVRRLDRPTLKVSDVEGATLIVSVVQKATEGAFPVAPLVEKWRHSTAQLALLQLLIAGPAQLQQVWGASPERVQGVQAEDGTPQTNLIWGYPPLLNRLLQLSDVEGEEAVAPLLAAPLAACPELLLASLAQCRPSWGRQYGRLVAELFGRFAASSTPHSKATLQRLWGESKDLMMVGLVQLYSKQGSAQVLKLTQELGILLEVLAMRKDKDLLLDLAVAAGQQKALPFANWATKAAEDGGDGLALAVVAYLRERVYGGDGKTRREGESVPAEYASVLLQAVQRVQLGSVAAAEVARLAQEVQGSGSTPAPQQAAAVQPPAQQDAEMPMAGKEGSEEAVVGLGKGAAVRGTEGQPGSAVQGQGQPSALFSPEIEEEANSHFQRIYTSEMEIERVVQMLKGFKASSSQREQEVFACMIHNLFDEYRFFPRYPERELLITGKLFGSLIQQQLISSITLGIALRYVLEALRKPLRSNMFKFGMCALEQFKQRLVEWPQYCHHVLQIAHIRQAHEDLIQYIQQALSNVGSRPVGAQEPSTSQPAMAAQLMQPQATQQQGGAAAQGGFAPAAGGFMGGAPGGAQGAQSMSAPGPQVQAQTKMFSKPQVDMPLAMQPQPPPMQNLGGMTQPTTAAQAQANALGAFEGQQVPSAGAYAGFSQGFGQDPQHPLPSNLHNFAADSGGAAGAAAPQEQVQRLDMQSSAVQQTLSVVSGASAFGATTNVDMLMQRASMVAQPDSNLQDKVHFVFNNLSNTNLDAKEKDLLGSLGEQHVPWLIQYIVIKRAAQEQNYLTLYLQFVDRLDKKLSQFLKGIVSCTIDNIKILLADDKVTSSSSMRSLLKNLGSWLGMLTIQKNKPILQRDLDLKALIIDAFEKGRLIAVVPFVAKIIETCGNSRIFSPPNPWTMLVLSLLAELHPMDDLKLNVKFEVEVLCKSLNRDIKDIRPSRALKHRTTVKEGNPDWSSRVSDAGLGAIKPLPSVQDDRLMDVAARMAAQQAPQPGAVPAAPPPDPAAAASQPGAQPAPAAAEQDMQNINIANYVTVNHNTAIFQQYPHLVQPVVQSVNQALKDMVAPVVERSVTIACITARELVLKDFALEQDEQQLKQAAHVMVQNLAGSLALVTCKEPLRHSICSQIRAMLTKTNLFDAQTIDQTAQLVAADNLDLGCNLIEKAATEKAVRDMDVALDVALVHRHKPGSPFHESFVQVQTWLRYLPEALRAKASGLMPHQRRVYEDFARIPRERLAQMTGAAAQGAADPALRAFNEGQNVTAPLQMPVQPPQQPHQPQTMQAPQAGEMRMAVEKMAVFLSKAEEAVMRSPQMATSPLGALPQGHELPQLILQSRAMLLQTAAREDVAVGYALKLVARVHDKSQFGRSLLGVDWLCTSLVMLADISRRVPKEITMWVALADGDVKMNRELTVALVPHRLLMLNAPEYVKEVVKAMDMGRNAAAVDMVVSVLQVCVVEQRCLPPADCSRLLDALAKAAQGPRKGSEPLLQLLEDARSLARGAAAAPGGAEAKGGPRTMAGMLAGWKAKEPEPAGLREQIGLILEQWVMQVQSNDERAVLQSMTMLLQQGWLKGDDTTDRFFGIAVETCIERSCNAMADPAAPAALGYVQVDSLSKLVLVLARYHDEWRRSTTMTKAGMVNKVLSAVARVMHSHQAERRHAFNQKPFHRLLTRLLQDLADPIGDPLYFALAEVLHGIQPRVVPGFSFAWLELASNRGFMPKLLQAKATQGWQAFHRVLIGLFRYLEPFLRTADLNEPIKLLYKGTLRVLLVLLHDFPEFLGEYHTSLCDVIPSSCIQLRNLILSAFPRSMLLPDPFTPQLKVDLLPEISKPPPLLPTTFAALPDRLRADVDSQLKGRGREGFLSDLPHALLLANTADMVALGTRYNVAAINALVLYVAASPAAAGNSPTGAAHPSSGPGLEILRKLSVDLDTEGRYLFFNAIANQLRYPNSHTHYFSCMMLNLFQAAGDKEIIREQITRVLIERLIVNKPHPWGLLITFIELIKNPIYDMWRHDFVRSCSEIEQLFQSVARFCLPQQAGGSAGQGASGDVLGVQGGSQ